jgi:hypothetical protein
MICVYWKRCWRSGSRCKGLASSPWEGHLLCLQEVVEALLHNIKLQQKQIVTQLISFMQCCAFFGSAVGDASMVK